MTADFRRARLGAAAVLAGALGIAAAPSIATAADAAVVAEGKAAPAPDKKAPAPAPATKAAPAPVADPAPTTSTSSSDAGIAGAVSDFISRSGDRWKELTIFGMKPKMRISEQISYTDNVFYQTNGERLVIDRDPDFISDGINARPRLGEPRGKVSDIVNVASLNFGLEMPVNLALVPIIRDRNKTLRVFDSNVTSVVYMRHHDSPDALNYDATLDFPAMLNEWARRLLSFNVGQGALYFRTEATYSRITDPLDVAKFQVHDEAPTFVRGEERNDFERVEYAFKGTLGWRSQVWDASVGSRFYKFRVKDRSLDSADHRQSSYFAEAGHTFAGTEQRAFVFVDYTDFGFDERTAIDTKFAKGGEVTTLRDFERYKYGVGWEGPLLSKKLQSRVEAFWIGVDVDDRRKSPRPVIVDPDDRTKAYERSYDEPHLVGFATRQKYAPTQKTQFQFEYGRGVEWSVVSENKVVDKATFTVSHEFNPRVTGTFKYSIENENVAFLQKRTFQEVGVGVRYKLFKYTFLTAEYTLRHMRSRREPVAVYADRANQPYTVRANGDFTANIITVGVSVEF